MVTGSVLTEKGAKMRLIDADALRNGLCVECTLYPDKCLKDKCDWGSIYHIDHAPTVDPEKHGKWEYKKVREYPQAYDFARCSLCGSGFIGSPKPLFGELNFAKEAIEKMKYCPFCGAAMDGGE